MDEIRPIDANALKKHITDIFETEEKIDKKWAMGLKYSLKIIDLAPTINPEKKLQTPSCLTNPERQAELLERYKEE